MGSLTLSTISALSHTSSALPRILAPAASYSPSSICEPTPALFSTYTSWPWAVSSWTPIGVMATRYSWFLTSLGTPTFTGHTPHSRAHDGVGRSDLIHPGRPLTS